MTKTRTFWFTAAALCIALAVFIFGGRAMLNAALSDGLYKALVLSAYLLLAGAAGSLTKAFTVTGTDQNT